MSLASYRFLGVVFLSVVSALVGFETVASVPGECVCVCVCVCAGATCGGHVRLCRVVVFNMR